MNGKYLVFSSLDVGPDPIFLFFVFSEEISSKRDNPAWEKLANYIRAVIKHNLLHPYLTQHKNTLYMLAEDYNFLNGFFAVLYGKNHHRDKVLFYLYTVERYCYWAKFVNSNKIYKGDEEYFHKILDKESKKVISMQEDHPQLNLGSLLNYNTFIKEETASIGEEIEWVGKYSTFIKREVPFGSSKENQDISYWYYLADSVPDDVDCLRILLELFDQKRNQFKSNYDFDRVIIKLEEKLDFYFLNYYFSNFIQKKFTKREDPGVFGYFVLSPLPVFYTNGFIDSCRSILKVEENTLCNPFFNSSVNLLIIADLIKNDLKPLLDLRLEFYKKESETFGAASLVNEETEKIIKSDLRKCDIWLNLVNLLLSSTPFNSRIMMTL